MYKCRFIYFIHYNLEFVTYGKIYLEIIITIISLQMPTMFSICGRITHVLYEFNSVRQTEIQAAESLVPETGYFEVTVSIKI
jgi:hypothetical protein